MRRPRVVAAVAISLVPAGCLPAAASEQGRSILDVYGIFTVGGVIVAGIVWLLATSVRRR